MRIEISTHKRSNSTVTDNLEDCNAGNSEIDGYSDRGIETNKENDKVNMTNIPSNRRNKKKEE